jgi:hypothetical protein
MKFWLIHARRSLRSAGTSCRLTASMPILQTAATRAAHRLVSKCSTLAYRSLRWVKALAKPVRCMIFRKRSACRPSACAPERPEPAAASRCRADRSWLAVNGGANPRLNGASSLRDRHSLRRPGSGRVAPPLDGPVCLDGKPTVNAGLRPPPSAADGVDSGPAVQPFGSDEVAANSVPAFYSAPFRRGFAPPSTPAAGDTLPRPGQFCASLSKSFANVSKSVEMLPVATVGR